MLWWCWFATDVVSTPNEVFHLISIRTLCSTDTLKLRQRLLRPHQSIDDCRYPGDKDTDTRHFDAFDDENLVGILSVYQRMHSQIKSAKSWQLRAMATADSVRGKGFGRQLLENAEAYVRSNEGELIWANARKLALGFYLKNGYTVEGSEFEVADIGLHYLVLKRVEGGGTDRS